MNNQKKNDPLLLSDGLHSYTTTLMHEHAGDNSKIELKNKIECSVFFLKIAIMKPNLDLQALTSKWNEIKFSCNNKINIRFPISNVRLQLAIDNCRYDLWK